jgi:hypothetical protein
MSYKGSASSKSPLPYPFCEDKFLKVTGSSIASSSDSESVSSTSTAIAMKKQKCKTEDEQMIVDSETASMVSCATFTERFEVEGDSDKEEAGSTAASTTKNRFQQIDEEQELDVGQGSKLDLVCSGCQKKVFRRTEFLLLPEKEDWCGKLWGHCLECSGMTAAVFKRNQRNRWHKRAVELHGKQDCLRVLQWKKLDGYLKEKMPETSNKQRRALISLRLKAMSMAMCLQFFEGSEAKQTAYVAVHQEYMEKIDEVCKENGKPSSQIQIAEADYLTSVAKGIQISYLCRKKDCRFYGMNDQWIQHESKYHFRCPMCGMQYYPWKQAEKWYAFQRVVTISHPRTGEQWIVPALWPASAEDDYLQKLMVVTASNIESQEDLDNFLAGKVQSLETMLANIGVPAAFKKFFLTEDVKYILRGCAGFGEKQYAKLDDNGFFGNVLDPAVAEQEPFDQWTEFAALFADLAKAGEEAVRKLKF